MLKNSYNKKKQRATEKSSKRVMPIAEGKTGRERKKRNKNISTRKLYQLVFTRKYNFKYNIISSCETEK
jgi:hypothetical protein